MWTCMQETDCSLKPINLITMYVDMHAAWKVTTIEGNRGRGWGSVHAWHKGGHLGGSYKYGRKNDFVTFILYTWTWMKTSIRAWCGSSCCWRCIYYPRLHLFASSQVQILLWINYLGQMELSDQLFFLVKTIL